MQSFLQIELYSVENKVERPLVLLLPLTKDVSPMSIPRETKHFEFLMDFRRVYIDLCLNLIME